MTGRILIFLMWCLFCVEGQGQKIRNIAKAGKAVVSHPRLLVVAEIPKTLPRNTPSPPAYVKMVYADPNDLKASKGYQRPILLLDNVKSKQGDSIFIELRGWANPFEVRDGAILVERPKKPYFIYKDNQKEYGPLKFPIGVSELYPSEFSALNFTFSARLKDTQEPVEKDVTIAVGTTKYTTRSLFGIDKNTYWKNQFIAFLDAHGNEFKDQNNEYSINTSNANEDPTKPNTNSVSQVFYSFLTRWEKMKEVEHISVPACVRFLKGCGIKVLTEETTYITWFRKAYYNNHPDYPEQIGPENLDNKEIDKQVEKWFEEHRLYNPLE